MKLTIGSAPYSPFYVLISFAFFVLVALSITFSPSFLIVAPLSISFILWIGFIAVRFVIALVSLNKHLALSIAAAPALISASVLIWIWSGVSPAMIRLFVLKNSYLAEIASHPPNATGLRFGMWSWREDSGAIIGSPISGKFLIYDSTDQISLPPQNRSTEWYRGVDSSGYKNNVFIHPELLMNPDIFYKDVHVYKLYGHFYIGTWVVEN